MGFFDRLFNRNKDIIEVQEEPNIKKEDFIDDSEPDKENNYTFNTGQGIDKIYEYLKIDFEKKGYEDAMANPDISYRDMNKSIIRSQLEINFNQIKVKYEDKLRLIDFHINSRRDAGLIDVVNQLISHKEQLLEHQSKLLKMEKDLVDNKPYMISMLLSYDKGFAKGLAALSIEQLKS
ncbi:MAG: hypothetical protein RR202_05515 [Bacteroidales bacterium]